MVGVGRVDSRRSPYDLNSEAFLAREADLTPRFVLPDNDRNAEKMEEASGSSTFDSWQGQCRLLRLAKTRQTEMLAE